MRSVYKWTRIILILTETVVLAVAKVYFTAREQKGGRADSISLHVVICKCIIVDDIGYCEFKARVFLNLVLLDVCSGSHIQIMFALRRTNMFGIVGFLCTGYRTVQFWQSTKFNTGQWRFLVWLFLYIWRLAFFETFHRISHIAGEMAGSLRRQSTAKAF
jgi:hypothetical protein